MDDLLEREIYDVGQHGEIGPSSFIPQMAVYVSASLDAMISILGSAIWAAGMHSAQCKILRKEPSLIPNSVLEVLRHESPVQLSARGPWVRYGSTIC
ncbi:hypothetical protein [Streptomyces lanatus]|uniref:Uncharacterized protein n=1 Tax=Streptomyces lanatus TaxID=66900 RepID=A0ABV1Y5Y9_9ACTN|nr:hypothetical protein [Streptomyces lanatus]